MAATQRQIDKVPPADGGNVEVLVLGLSRTGTMSMYNALKILSYKPYHMYEACLNAGKGHLIFWNEAIDAKYGKSSTLAPYNSSDFHKLLQDHTATSDAPTVLFVPELMATYPNAHLILTTHPGGVDAWLRSMNNSYFRICNWGIWSWLLIPYDASFSRPYVALLKRIIEMWTKEPWSVARDFEKVRRQLRITYEQHNEQVRKLAMEQKRPLLEFDPTQGWTQLCEFLGKDLPVEPYPHANQGDYVVNLHKFIVLKRIKDMFQTPVFGVVGGSIVLGIAVWWYRR